MQGNERGAMIPRGESELYNKIVILFIYVVNDI